MAASREEGKAGMNPGSLGRGGMRCRQKHW